MIIFNPQTGVALTRDPLMLGDLSDLTLDMVCLQQ